MRLPRQRLQCRACEAFWSASEARLVLERYFGGMRATTLANIKSASKSVISALVGIAIDRKLLGQFIFVVPELDMVVVTGALSGRFPARRHRERHRCRYQV